MLLVSVNQFFPLFPHPQGSLGQMGISKDRRENKPKPRFLMEWGFLIGRVLAVIDDGFVKSANFEDQGKTLLNYTLV